MASFKKAILREDTYISPDRPDEPLVVTAERLHEWARKHEEIVKSGRRIPIDFDHSYDVKENVPVTKRGHARRRSASNSVGFMEVFRVGEDEDGTYAEILLDISDPIAQGRCERNEVYVSPVILDQWTDGRGKQYEDIIGHMDLVNHPVDDSQTEFEMVGLEPGAIACGIRLGLGAEPHPNIFRLAIGDRKMADDDDKVKKENKENEGGESSHEGGVDGDDSGIDTMKLAKQAMDKIGAEIPVDFDPMTSEGFALMMTAIMNRLDSGENTGHEDEGDLEVQRPEFATMSADHPAKQAFNFAQKAHRETIQTRLDLAFKSGRITKQELADKTALVGSVKLSLDKNSKQREGNLEVWLKSREELPAGIAWAGENNQATHLSAEVRPEGWEMGSKNEETPKRAKEVADWVLGNKT